MAAPRGFHPQTVFCNKFSLMVADIVRFAFIDERENVGREVETVSVVAELVMTKEKALELADYIISSINTPQPVFNNGPEPKKPVEIPDESFDRRDE